MSNNAAADQDALYYLYVNGDWAGPYQVSQIREHVKQGAVAVDTYAYAASQQRHYTVEELLAAPTPTPAPMPALDDPGSSSSGARPGSIAQGMSVLFDDIVDMAPQSSAAFENVLPDLKAFYLAYLGLTEHTAEPQQTLKELHSAHQALIQELDHRRTDAGALSRIINEIDEVADYLANRHQLAQLWSLLSELEKVDLKTNVEDGVNSARAVLATLIGRAETQSSVGENSGSVLLDLAGLEDDADSVITRKILISARSEVANAKRDMDVLQQTYNELQDQHAKDLEKARKLLEKAEAARAEERHTARQAAAEVRGLAAEIQRLASDPDIAGGSNQKLAEEVARLGEELNTADASTLSSMAEDVLVRMVAELRQLAAKGSAGTISDAAPLRAELARARESLAQAHAQVAQLTSERDALALQYEQSRVSAEKASERAKDREHRLRSTVTALEVTKELHQEVMDDLKLQLQNAQGRVEQMERDLASVRGEMKDSTGTVEARSKAIQHEMQRMVETKAMLEVRSNELSESLKTAEDELAKAQSSDEDTGLAEALAAKVTQLRTTYETTTNRLREQEANAERLTRELEASRREAEELRGRGDQLSGELGEARGSLSAAKHRLDELHQAYSRLEAERESLHTELLHRKSTDTIHRSSSSDEHQSERLNRLERESGLLQRQLTAERRQGEQLAETRQQLENRITELTTEREDLRRRFEVLQNEHFNNHARHTAAIAVTTQAAIESERRLRELQGRVGDLEARLAAARKGTEGDRLEPTTARVASHSNALESAEQEHLRTELEQVARERDQVLAELETIRTSATARSNEVPEVVAKRLIELERGLTAAKAEVAALDERHAQAVAERDRLRREAERLKGERESAAMEHRTALKSARDRLTESQARVAALERQAGEHANGERDGQVLRGHLDQSLVEQERLSHEVQRLASELARINAALPADRDQQLIGLAKASQQLAGEQEKVLVLTRSLMETLQQADNARGRTLELQSQLDQRTNERDQLQQELDRQRAQLTDLRLGAMGDQPLRDETSALFKRDQAIADLDEVRSNLAETRARLTDTHRASSTLENLGKEKERIRELEKELATLRTETDQRQQMFNEARARLVQVSSERDRLAAELAEIKSRPDQSAELKMLRRRLIRAKRLIKRLRRERDDALAERQKSATNLYELTGQIERLKNSQRAAAEALGLSPSAIPADLGTVGDSSHGSRVSAGFSSGGFGTRDHGPAITPMLADTPPSKKIPKALTRRIMPSEAAKQPGLGFTSAFGRPMIPPPPGSVPSAGLVPAGMESGHNVALQTHVTAVLTAKPSTHAPWHRRFARQPLTLGAVGLLALGTAALFVLPPFIPLSTQALVIAPVTVVDAPIDGQFQAETLSRLADISRGQAIGTVRNEHVDTSALKSLQARRDGTRAKQSETREHLSDTQRSVAALHEQVDLYRTGLIQDLERRLGEERTELAKRNTALGTTLDRTAVPGALAAVESQQNLIEQLSRRLTVLRSGQFDVADAPVAQRRIDEQTVRIAELEEQSRVFDMTLNELDVSITEEEQRVAALRSATITAPVAGTLWSQQAANRQPLVRGGEILRLADPTRIEVVALLPERYRYNVTSDSVIEVITDSGRHLRGTMSGGQLLPATHQKAGMTSELTPPAQGYDKLYVTLDPSASPLPIGQQVKVVVLGRNPGVIDRTLAWFYENTRL